MNWGTMGSSKYRGRRSRKPQRGACKSEVHMFCPICGSGVVYPLSTSNVCPISTTAKTGISVSGASHMFAPNIGTCTCTCISLCSCSCRCRSAFRSSSLRTSERMCRASVTNWAGSVMARSAISRSYSHTHSNTSSALAKSSPASKMVPS